MASFKVSEFTQVTDTTDDSLLLLSYTSDSGSSFASRKIRIADFLNDITHTSKADVDVDHLETLTGMGAAADDLGTFTGSTIADSATIKAALQALETEVETKQDGLTAGNGLDLTGTTVSVDLGSGTGYDYTELVLSGHTSSDFNGTYSKQSTQWSLDTATISGGSAQWSNTGGYAFFVKDGDASRAVVYSEFDSAWYAIFKTSADFTSLPSDGSTVSLNGIEGRGAGTSTYLSHSAPTDGSGSGSYNYTYDPGAYLEISAGKLIASVKDEDDMSSDSADHLASQQSIKAYVDSSVSGLATSSTITEIDGNVDDLVSLSGVAENDTDLGTFTGNTIADSSTIKAALQSLETALEDKVENNDNVNSLVGSTTAQTEPATYLFLVVDTSDGSIKVIDKTFVEAEG